MKKHVTTVDITGKKRNIPAGELTWRPTAYGIVIKDNKLLLSKQFDGYDLPGGGVNLGELPSTAVLREVKEETGIIVNNPQLLEMRDCFFTFRRPRNGKNHFQMIVYYYKCDYQGGKLSIDGFDQHEKEYADMPEWIAIKDVNSVKVASTIDWRPLIKKLA